jgi:hypothetical protein
LGKLEVKLRRGRNFAFCGTHNRNYNGTIEGQAEGGATWVFNLNVFRKMMGMNGYQGVNVPIDLRGSFPVYSPKALFTLFATNCVFLVRSAYPLMPSPQACLITMKQL